MVQMHVAPQDRVDVNFQRESLPISIKIFQPVLFQDGEGYGCLWGPDFHAGIYGQGKTAEEALSNWDLHLRDRIKSKDHEDDVAQHVINILEDAVEFG